MSEETLMSEFNSNKATLIRIDKLMQATHVSFFNEDWEAVYKDLRSLRVECVYKMDKDFKTACDKSFKELITLRQTYKSEPHNPNVVHIYTMALDEFWIFLTEFMGKKGMLLNDKEDDGGL